MTATRTEPLGLYLLRRLREAGVGHVFGVAGDFNLELLEQMEGFAGLEWVGCCNELNAAYAADGYARTHGFGVLLTTYGVGELSALCGVAGACAEHVPLIAISGAPPMAEIRRHGLMHHTTGAGDYGDMMACASQFSVAQARLTPQNAVAEITRCLRACRLESKPVYLQPPCDLAYTEIEVPTESYSLGFQSDAGGLEDFARITLDRLAAAERCAILVDADVGRFGLGKSVQHLAERLGCPIAAMSTAKGVIDETHPAYLGIYAGHGSPDPIHKAIEGADCLLMLAVRFVDSTTASFSQQIDPRRAVEIWPWHARTEGVDFQGIFVGDVLERLATVTPAAPFERAPPAAAPAPPRALSQAWFWHRIGHFLRKDDVVIAENGTSLTGITGTALPTGATLIAQALWGAIGYALPATFGSLVAAPARRHLLFIGDGSFQVTAQELSSILRHRLHPTVFLINNDGYTIERLILGADSSYNDIQPWKYAALCEVFAAGTPFESRRVTTADELDAALDAAADPDRCWFIEIELPRMDAPESLKQLGPIFARQDYGRAWAERSHPTDRGPTSTETTP